MNCLPDFNKVFFIHYQCDNFNTSTEIYNLQIFAKGKAKEYTGRNEAEFIRSYCERVKELCDEGLIPVHWNQNRSFFGPDHIISRYKDLTKEDIELEYINEIQLSDWLINTYGDEYVSHPRLDKLAELNQFNGNSQLEANTRTFNTNRLMLLSKIYFRALNNNLVTEKNAAKTAEHVKPNNPKTKVSDGNKNFEDYLIHSNKSILASEIKKEFISEKGKGMRLLLEAMQSTEPPIMTYCTGEGKKLYNALNAIFEQKIGSYNSIFGYKYDSKIDQKDINALLTRLNFILKNLK